MCVEEAAVIVAGDKDPKTTCTITLTSPIMRDENMPDGGKVALHNLGVLMIYITVTTSIRKM